MKKTILLLLLILIAYSCNSQLTDEINFKVQYKPGTRYNQTLEQTSESNVKYIGSEEILQKLKDKGIKNPTITKQQSKIETLFKTEKATIGDYFPLTLEFVNSTSSDGKKIIPDGTIIYGHSNIGSLPTLDSINSNQLDEEYKKTLLQTMQSTMSQISLPEKKLKIGDEFSRDIPLSIPVAGINIDMLITTNYKLVNIKNGVADFDISQTYKMRTVIEKYNVNATGSGKGKLLYDVASNFYLKYQTESEMHINMKLENFDIEIETKSGYKQTTIITKN
jgi:hypothetical protein